MRKILSWVLLACMILTMIPVSIAAETAAAPAEPALKEAPADAVAITDLATLMLSSTQKGNYKFTGNLHVTLDMIDAYMASLEEVPPTIPATIKKDGNGDAIYYLEDGKIAYDKVNGETRIATDKEGNPTGENVKDANGDDVYYVKNTDPLNPVNAIAYDTVNGKTLRAYDFAGPLITTDKPDDAKKTPEENTAIWDANKNALAIYGCGYSLTFEDGINFAGGGVLFNKVYGDISVYDLSVGTEEKPISFNAGFANIGIIAGGVVDVTWGEEKLESKLTCDNVDVYGTINEEKRGNANNNVGGFVAKPDTGTEVVIKNCNSYIDITRDTVKTGTGGNQYGGFVGTWKGDSLLIENSNNYGTMFADKGGAAASQGSAAGFVATTKECSNVDATVTLKNCVNYGNVYHARVAAGLIGYSACKVTVENCVNWGEIHQSDANDTTLPTAAAGLIGNVIKGEVVVTDCSNETSAISVFSPSKDAVTSGLIGLIADPEKVTLTNVFSFCSADIFMVNGAAIRFDAPTKLRFRASLSATLTYDALVEKYGAENITVGMKVAKLDDVKANNNSFEGLADDKVITTVGEWYDDEHKSFVATTGEIAEADYGTKYIASGYVTVKDAQGNEDTIYAAFVEETARSASDVAKAALADRSPVKMKIPGVSNYVYEISTGSWSEYTVAGNEKLQAYVVEEPADPATPAA